MISVPVLRDLVLLFQGPGGHTIMSHGVKYLGREIEPSVSSGEGLYIHHEQSDPVTWSTVIMGSRVPST